MKARLRIDPERVTGTIDRNIYGQFLSRRPGCAEGGLYDPAAPSADQDGIRADVSAAIAACRPTVIRWPGGCTGTSYHWLDGVGPVALDAWVECDTFDSPERRLFHLPYLDASVTVDPAAGQLYLSLVNRHREQPLELEVRLFDAAVRAGGTAHVLFHDDPLAMNGPERPENVCWQSRPVHLEGSRFTYELLPHSYTILELLLARHTAPIEA
jgi:alpha-L-arabinofuranosidase